MFVLGVYKILWSGYMLVMGFSFMKVVIAGETLAGFTRNSFYSLILGVIFPISAPKDLLATRGQWNRRGWAVSVPSHRHRSVRTIPSLKRLALV